MAAALREYLGHILADDPGDRDRACCRHSSRRTVRRARASEHAREDFSTPIGYRHNRHLIRYGSH
jgi:hypothetical protein